MPLAKMRSAFSRISSFVTVLLMTRRRRSEPVSGAMVSVRSPLCRSSRDDGRREIVEAQRGRADRIAHLGQARQDELDVGMIAESNRHQAHAVGVGPGGLRQFQDAVGGKRPHRQVVVARPAEAAEVGAAAHHFDQEPRAELGVGREDRRARRVDGLGRLEGGLLHDRRGARARAGHVGVDRAVVLRRSRRRTTGCRSRDGWPAASAGRRARWPRPPPRAATAPAPRLHRRQ